MFGHRLARPGPKSVNSASTSLGGRLVCTVNRVLGIGSELRHLVERARDPAYLGTEVDGHCRALHLDDSPHPVGVVGHHVVDRVLLDRGFGIWLEWAAGEVPPGPCWGRH